MLGFSAGSLLISSSYSIDGIGLASIFTPRTSFGQMPLLRIPAEITGNSMGSVPNSGKRGVGGSRQGYP